MPWADLFFIERRYKIEAVSRNRTIGLLPFFGVRRLGPWRSRRRALVLIQTPCGVHIQEFLTVAVGMWCQWCVGCS